LLPVVGATQRDVSSPPTWIYGTVAATTRKPFLEQLLRIGTTTCKLLYASPSFAIQAVVEQNF
jgi:hypothetical protein